MRLTDLDPRWINRDGQRVGFTFVSPTNPTYRQTCFFESPPFRDQCKLLALVLGADADDPEWPRLMVQTCKEGTRWTIEGEFGNLTCSPSLDGSAGGLWHGHIQNGVIVGGLPAGA